ncbi:SAM-dependent DNA methyltransferase [Brucella sp. 6810]|uniref:SAM-dependent DNA methyltransferase n=1 Tax=Brucella sp. 6810 TaxID=2769351 RepID=UPI00165B2364|nr:SAM-dependent DNA methyltransferase [Brucella sp. 6810]QNQ63905.1 SAM-dependent DNA methyltransferase [Brucella sp. 6810]
MARQKERDIWQYGDFQTPPELAQQICGLLSHRGINPTAIVEPTCGRGAFLAAATTFFPLVSPLLGVEINEHYVTDARELLGASATIECGNFFAIDWDAVLARHEGPWLVLGNPPWVTNAELGLLKSTNLPIKTNFQGHQGLDAITGKANFDISEWMLLKQLEWLKERSGWIAMLVKTSVARKVLRQAWKKSEPVGRAAIYKIDAMKYFGAAVDACLFILPVETGDISQDCDVYEDLAATSPITTIGFHDEFLVSDVAAYLNHRDLIGRNSHYIWRSGVKHDCSKVMEVSAVADGAFENGLGVRVALEQEFVFPLLKSSDVSKGRHRTERFVIVTQREIGGDTSTIASTAPKTWEYLLDNSVLLDARGSVIYRGKPRFSVFGVGPYTYAPWKVAISGFYKSTNFMKVGPIGNQPVVMDDTVYFLPCQSEEEADFIMALVNSKPYVELLGSIMFNDEKRPITAELLKRISLEKTAVALGLSDQYARYTDQATMPQFQLTFG